MSVLEEVRAAHAALAAHVSAAAPLVERAAAAIAAFETEVATEASRIPTLVDLKALFARIV